MFLTKGIPLRKVPSQKKKPFVDARRLLWAAMLALHLIPLVAAFRGLTQSVNDWMLAGGVTRVGVLGVCVLFFVLKIADVAWLRLKPGWKSIVSSLVIVALLHAGAFAHDADGESTVLPKHLVVLATMVPMLDAGIIRRGMRYLTGGQIPARLRRPHDFLGGFWLRAAVISTLRPVPAFVLTMSAPRAPPSR